MGNFQRVFGDTKPVIGMVHLAAMPGTPLYDPKGGIDGMITAARADLIALQEAGFDAIMFGNENDRPYEFAVDPATTATMAYVIGQLRPEITVPFGVNVLWDPTSTIALAAATGAAFAREIFTGTYASDMGPWAPDAGKAMRYSTTSPPNSPTASTDAPCPTARAPLSSPRSPMPCWSPARSRVRPPGWRTSKPSRPPCPTRPCSPTPASSTTPLRKS